VAELKTQKTNASVSKFINAIEDDQRRKDCKAIAAIIAQSIKRVKTRQIDYAK
jgi:hypothetical protein